MEILSLRGDYTMNIYIDNEYKDIKIALLDRGYNVINDNSVPCDAVICNLKNCDFSNISEQINLKREGAIIIDCGSKNVDEIDNILNNRAYSSIL
ncbi:YkuS family protein [Clostridium thermarum]|uniref:YkuS family protein n=2 Tax=Clostridium thermarum TaxID=1716543 RepID=UPI00111CD981|nr:YkuS family protein [Clostridium thermarum]